MKLTHNCPKCGKPAKIQSEFPVGNLINYVYQCGHIELKPKLTNASEANAISEELNKELARNKSTLTATLVKEDAPAEPTYKELYDDLDRWVSDGGLVKGADLQKDYIHQSFFSCDGRKCAYPYQIEGIKWLESRQLRGIIGDAMGLGKTIQALIAFKRNKQVASPVGIIVKGATLFQWAREYHEWVSQDFRCMPVTSRNHVIPGMDAYIFSMDMLAKPDFVTKLQELNLKCLIIDEVQNFKDASAKRTIGLMNLIKLSNIEYIVPLSGTPAKNRANELFVPLNLVAPDWFSSKDEFQKRWLMPDNKGQYSRVNPFKLDEFKEHLSKFMIRREKFEVLKNLPDLTRDYQLIEIDDPVLKSSYNNTLDLFKNWLNDNKTGIKSTELLGWLAQLRAITGQAKCKNAIEWTKDFIESTDESLAIGIQHHSVRDTLYYVLEQFKIRTLKLSGEDSIYRKNDIVRAFTNNEARVLVINSLAGGVGLNLQTCANALVLERQWNSADEEQFESRFHRDGQKKAVTITYMIAKGTLDEFFHDLVLRKRNILAETGVGSQWDLTSDINTLRDLAEAIVSHKI